MGPVTTDALDDAPAAEAAWDAYVDAHPAASVHHRAVFRRIIRDGTGNGGVWLRAWRGGRMVGVLPLGELKSAVFGHSLNSLPYFNHCGVLADDAAARAALLEAAAEHARRVGARHVELRHLGEAPEGVTWPARSHKVEMLLDLPADSEALMRGFKAKLRSQIRRPKKAGLYTRLGGLELLPDFYEVFARNMRDLGTPVYGRRFFQAFLSHLADRTRVAVCYLAGRPVGAGIVVGWRDVLEIPWASTVREANTLSPNMLLYWQVLAYAADHGYRRFDFGRSTPGEGTFQFKSQWGAQPVPLYWYYWLRDGGPLPEVNPKNPKFDLAIRVWRRLPVAVTRVIGPHVVKNLP